MCAALSSSWACAACTAVHSSEAERSYLSCSVCGATRPEGATARPEEEEEGEPSSWECVRCTYSHESPEERRYLRCGLCGAERGSTRKKRKTTTVAGLLRRAPTGTPVRSSVDGRKRDVDDADLDGDEYPAYFRRRFLSEDDDTNGLGTTLLRWLAEEAKGWESTTWVVHGKTHVVPRRTKLYRLLDDDSSDSDSDSASPQKQKRGGSPLAEAAKVVEREVRRTYPGWRATLVLANRYVDGEESVGKHSDFLMEIGPRAVVAGLSLGAERTFRLTSKTEKRRVLDVPTPHGSLVVMKAGCQEDYNHEVPKCATASIRGHPTAGTTRFSLTFRMERPEVQRNCRQNCHCGKPCGLKSLGGRYVLFCHPAGTTADAMCTFRKPCPWAEADARRLKTQEEEGHTLRTTTASVVPGTLQQESDIGGTM